MDKLDPLRAFVVDRITREGTRYVNGEIVKDLNYLNRDHSKVIAIDTDPKHYALHPENAIIVPKWDGDPKDKGLIALIPFLECELGFSVGRLGRGINVSFTAIAIYSPPDVRPIISAYKDKDVVAEYAKVEAEAKRRHLEDWLKHGGGAKVSAPSFLQKIFGTATTTVSPFAFIPFLTNSDILALLSRSRPPQHPAPHQPTSNANAPKPNKSTPNTWTT